MTSARQPRQQPSRKAAARNAQRTAAAERQAATDWPCRPIVLWISPEIRSRHPDMPLSLAERCALRRPQPSPDIEPDKDPEAEP